MKSENRLSPENCNKAKCKTCIFGPTPVDLTIERKNEINDYLINFKYSHICHTTEKTCYGALELQAKILYGMGVIHEPTPEAMIKVAKQFLK